MSIRLLGLSQLRLLSRLYVLVSYVLINFDCFPCIKYNCVFYVIAGAPKVLLDGLLSDITVAAGEPFRIKVPFKGSPAPVAKWFNVRSAINQFHVFNWFAMQLEM